MNAYDYVSTSVTTVPVMLGITMVKLLSNCRFDAIVGSMTNLNQLIADFESRNHHHYGNPQNQATEMNGVAGFRDSRDRSHGPFQPLFGPRKPDMVPAR